jgi:hypothetical protein
MNTCLNERDLLRLQIADDSEFSAERIHLKECPACAERARELARDTRLIADALSATAADARALRPARRVRAKSVRGPLRIRYSLRKITVFSGAAVCGGVAALGVLLALGWRPSEARDPQSATAQMRPTELAVAARTPRYTTISDPISAIAYGESGDSDAYSAITPSGTPVNNSEAFGALLFCGPGDDGTFCSAAGNQG